MVLGIILGILVTAIGLSLGSRYKKDSEINLLDEITTFVVSTVQNIVLPSFVLLGYGLARLAILIYASLTKRRVYGFLTMLSVGVTVLGIYVYVKNRSTVVAQPTFVTASTPVDTPVPRRKPRRHRADSTPAPVTSALNSTPTPVSASAVARVPEPVPSRSVRRVGENRWQVIVAGQGWFDTGIPVIANQSVSIQASHRRSAEGAARR